MILELERWLVHHLRVVVSPIGVSPKGGWYQREAGGSWESLGVSGQILEDLLTSRMCWRRLRENKASLQGSWPDWLEHGGFSLRCTELGPGGRLGE